MSSQPRTLSEESSLSVEIIQMIAAEEDADPVELPPLYHYIDPEALDSLFDSTSTGQQAGEITFSYLDYPVTVSVENGTQMITVSVS